MRIFDLLLWLLNQYIVIELWCPQRAALTGKLPQNRNKQGNETGLAGLTVTRDGDDLRRHLPPLP